MGDQIDIESAPLQVWGLYQDKGIRMQCGLGQSRILSRRRKPSAITRR